MKAVQIRRPARNFFSLVFFENWRNNMLICCALRLCNLVIPILTF